MTNAESRPQPPEEGCEESWRSNPNYRAADPGAIADMFSFHPADTPAKRDAHEYARGLAGWVAQELIRFLPPSDDVAEAIKHLRMAAMFANADLAINGGPAGRMFADGRKPNLPDVDRAQAIHRFEAFLAGTTEDDQRLIGQAFAPSSDEQVMYELGVVAGLESELSGRVVPEQAPGPRFDAIYRAGINQGRHLAGILRRNTERWSPDALAEYAKSTERAEAAIAEAGSKLANNMNGASKLVRDAFDRGYRQATADRAAGYSPPTGPETADFPVINPPAPGVEVPVKTGGPDYRARATQDDLDRAFGDHPAEPPRPPLLADPAALQHHMAMTNTVLSLCAPAMLLAEGDTPALTYYPERKSYGLQLITREGQYEGVRPQDLKAGKSIVYPSGLDSSVRSVFRSLRNAGYPVRSNEEPALSLEDGAVDQVPGYVTVEEFVAESDRVAGRTKIDQGKPSSHMVTDSQPTVAGMPTVTSVTGTEGEDMGTIGKPDPVAKAKEDLTKATAARRSTPKGRPVKDQPQA